MTLLFLFVIPELIKERLSFSRRDLMILLLFGTSGLMLMPNDFNNVTLRESIEVISLGLDSLTRIRRVRPSLKCPSL